MGRRRTPAAKPAHPVARRPYNDACGAGPRWPTTFVNSPAANSRSAGVQRACVRRLLTVIGAPVEPAPTCPACRTPMPPNLGNGRTHRCLTCPRDADVHEPAKEIEQRQYDRRWALSLLGPADRTRVVRREACRQFCGRRGLQLVAGPAVGPRSYFPGRIRRGIAHAAGRSPHQVCGPPSTRQAARVAPNGPATPSRRVPGA